MPASQMAPRKFAFHFPRNISFYMKKLILVVFTLYNLALYADVELKEVTDGFRESCIKRAQVWRPTEVSKMDIMAGPQNEISVPPGAEFVCTYVEPKEKLAGVTQKFLCKTESGDVVRVKYGKENKEMYSEIAATRLFWALGFYADEVYPVKLRCLGCPEKDPSNPEPGEKRIDATLEYATVERNFSGANIEVKEDQGWDWEELEKISEAEGGAPRSHVDALKLLAVFVQHADSKPSNQRVACYPEDVLDQNDDGIVHCKRPVMMIQDLGSTFGSGTTALNVSKINFDQWKGAEVWNVPKQANSLKDTVKPVCYGKITASHAAGEHGLSDPAISEEGRRFLADLLKQLTHQQIVDIFRVTGVERLDEFVEEDGVKRRIDANDWADVFNEKRAEIIEHDCPVLSAEK
jgi:hypothetical protein